MPFPNQHVLNAGSVASQPGNTLKFTAVGRQSSPIHPIVYDEYKAKQGLELEMNL